MLDAGLPSSAGEAMKAALSRSPAISASVESLRAARAAVKTRSSALEPRVEGRLRTGVGHNYNALDGRKTDSVAEIVLNWNLFDGGGDQARVRQQVNQVNQAIDLREEGLLSEAEISGYLQRVLRFAVPAGVAASIVTLGSYWLAHSGLVDASLAEARTASTFALVSIAFWVLYRLMLPIDRYDALLLGTLLTAFGVILATPAINRFYALEWPPPAGVVGTAAITFASVAVLEFGLWRRDLRR